MLEGYLELFVFGSSKQREKRTTSVSRVALCVWGSHITHLTAPPPSPKPSGSNYRFVWRHNPDYCDIRRLPPHRNSWHSELFGYRRLCGKQQQGENVVALHTFWLDHQATHRNHIIIIDFNDRGINPTGTSLLEFRILCVIADAIIYLGGDHRQPTMLYLWILMIDHKTTFLSPLYILSHYTHTHTMGASRRLLQTRHGRQLTPLQKSHLYKIRSIHTFSRRPSHTQHTHTRFMVTMTTYRTNFRVKIVLFIFFVHMCVCVAAAISTTLFWFCTWSWFRENLALLLFLLVVVTFAAYASVDLAVQNNTKFQLIVNNIMR